MTDKVRLKSEPRPKPTVGSTLLQSWRNLRCRMGWHKWNTYRSESEPTTQLRGRCVWCEYVGIVDAKGKLV